jgi:hypothetical protein
MGNITMKVVARMDDTKKTKAKNHTDGRRP